MKTRLDNVFKSRNASKLAKPILKSSYKALSETILFAALRQHMRFLWAVRLLAIFKLQIDINLAIS